MEWTEKEDKRLLRRAKVFQEEGVQELDALNLAYEMLIRDRDGDDRRVCFECSKLQRNRYCTFYRDSAGKPQLALRFTLQRCEGFKLKEVQK